MKYINHLLATLFVATAIASCSEKEDIFEEEPSFTPQTYNVQGKVEKGPFISGSQISIQPMNSRLQILGNMFNTSIIDDQGSFILGSKEFETPYAEFMANGYFFNEVKGELSNGTLTLRALVNLGNSTTTNVNILTHLKYARIKNLVSSGKTFDEANTQAQKELLSAFGLSAYSNQEVSSFSITAGTDESAALIAISSLLLMERSEAELTEYLAKLSADFGNKGTFSQENKKQIEADKKELIKHLDAIRENIIRRYESLGISVNIKKLDYYIDWNNDGQAGNELLKEGESVKIETPVIEVPNEGGTYSIKIESPIQLFITSEETTDTITPINPGSNITNDIFFSELYEGYDYSDKAISYESNLEGDTLNINISALQSYNDKSESIVLYDYLGNKAATIKINQKGKKADTQVTEIPLLGASGQAIVANIAMQMVEALKEYNIIEQYYNSNATTNYVNRFVTPLSSQISSLWEKFYKLNSHLLTLKNADETRLNVYGDYCNILSAIYYTNLVYGWGAVPYFTKYEQIESSLIDGYPRVSADTIFNDLKNKLSKAIENLPEKRNESLKNQGFFFASKDVPRVLLANIYMYEGNYKEAEPLLKKVIENGYYSFDATAEEYLTLNNAQKSKELIFGLHNNKLTNHSDVKEVEIMPYITLSDVYLSLAECHYKMDNFGIAEQYIKSVTDAKKLTVIKRDALLKIKDAREDILLHSGTYFAFLKRTGLAKDICNIEEYQLLLPIPRVEVQQNPFMTQNPGY